MNDIELQIYDADNMCTAVTADYSMTYSVNEIQTKRGGTFHMYLQLSPDWDVSVNKLKVGSF